MIETSNRFYTEDVRREDMIEVHRRPKASRVKGVVKWLFVVLVCFAMAVVLIRGSQPALTPEQIVQLEGYEGQQSARRIFNLKSSQSEPAKPVQQESEVEQVVVKDGKPVETVVAPVIIEPAVQRVEPIVVPGTEVPAVATSASLMSSPREVSPETIAEFVAEIPAEQIITQPVSVSESRMLPVYIVADADVQMRSSPSGSSRVIKTLARLETVTLFAREGAWAQVAANDGSGTTGYVLFSQIDLDAQ